MRFTLSSFAVLALGAVVVTANNMPTPGTISPECEATIISVFSSPEAACLNPAGLAAFGSADPDTSLVPLIDTYLTGFCPLQACTNEALTTMATNLATGCSKEFAPLGITPEQFAEAVVAVYPTIRKAVCFVDTTTGGLCITQTLTNIEGVVGPLTPSTIGPALEAFFTGDPIIPPAVICTDCNKALYTLLQAELPQFFIPGTEQFLSDTCGAPFVDGTTPPTISQSAPGAVSAKFRRWAMDFAARRK